MCRFLVYAGREIYLADLITRSEQSLIRQSFRAREREEPLNGDGFGVGWYAHHVDPTPCVFTGVTPAWSNRNLQRLADKITSTCVFAHVRAASPGTGVMELNCHPFQYRQFLWMHNGRVPRFGRVRRRLREQLEDEFYDLIQGTTDSEHAFALFLNRMRERLETYDLAVLVDAMRDTIFELERLNREAGHAEPCYLNLALTDGRQVVATRYVGGEDLQPETLYVSEGDRFEMRDGRYDMVTGRDAGAVIIASEPLTDDRDDWRPVPRNHIVTVSPQLRVALVAI